MNERKEPTVDLDKMERTILANQLQPADANGGSIAEAMTATLEKVLHPRSITALCDGMTRQFGATANMMRNNAQRLRLRADALDQTADRLEGLAGQVTVDLKFATEYERRAYQMNQAAALASDEVMPEQ